MRSSGKNQRVSKPRQRRQQHLLEVTVRRDIARVQRNRAVIGFVCKSLLIVSLCVGAWIGGHEVLRRYLWENPEYYLSDIRWTTDGALTREQILTTAGLVEGTNIFSIDLTKSRNALDQLPQVERVELRRSLPNRIDITITERRPVAWVCQRAEEDPSASEKAFLIDARGVVMRSKTILPEYLHLPVISGVEVENLAPGQKVRSFEMQAALDLIRLTPDNTRFQVKNLDLSRGYCVLVTDQLHRKITFGLDRVDLQLERLMRCFEVLEPQGKELQTANLLVERNMPLTFFPPPEQVEEEVPAPVVAPRAVKEKAPVVAKKAGVASTPTASTTSKSARPSAGASRSRSTIDAVKKPFRP